MYDESQTKTELTPSNETLQPVDSSDNKGKVGKSALNLNVFYDNNEIKENVEVKTEVVGPESRSMIELNDETKRIATSCSLDDMPVLVVLEKDGKPSIYIQNYNNPMENKNMLSGELHDLTTEGGYKVQRLVILSPEAKTEIARNTNNIITDYMTDIVRNTNGGKDVDVQVCTYDEEYLSKEDVNLNAEFTQNGEVAVRVNAKKIKPTPKTTTPV
jgi:hypothetical protein